MGVSIAQALIVLLGAALWLLSLALLILWTSRRAANSAPRAGLQDRSFAGLIPVSADFIRSPLACRSTAPSRAPPLLFLRPSEGDFARASIAPAASRPDPVAQRPA